MNPIKKNDGQIVRMPWHMPSEFSAEMASSLQNSLDTTLNGSESPWISDLTQIILTYFGARGALALCVRHTPEYELLSPSDKSTADNDELVVKVHGVVARSFLDIIPYMGGIDRYFSTRVVGDKFYTDASGGFPQYGRGIHKNTSGESQLFISLVDDELFKCGRDRLIFIILSTAQCDLPPNRNLQTKIISSQSFSMLSTRAMVPLKENHEVSLENIIWTTFDTTYPFEDRFILDIFPQSQVGSVEYTIFGGIFDIPKKEAPSNTKKRKASPLEN